MIRRIYFLSVLLLVIATRVMGQQDPQFTQYMFNTLYYNPGFSGVEGITKITAIHRSQWLGYSPTVGGGGAPTTQMISFTTPIQRLNSGFGAFIVNDKLGPLTNQEIQGSFAYHLGIKDSKLSLGVRAGAYAQTIDFGLYRAIDPSDPLLADKTGTISQVRPDVAVGAFWRKEKFYVGASFDHLIKSTFDFGVSQRNSLQTHMYVTGGYFYELNFDTKFLFTSLIQSDFTKTTTNLGVIAYLKDTMWGGVSVRQSESASLILGYSLLKDKSLKVGSSVDFVLKDQAAKQPLSVEFLLSYELPTNPSSGKKIVRTPRYRK